MTLTKERILLTLALCLSAGLAVAATIEGRVVGVSDGDTVSVLDAAWCSTKSA